MRGINHGKQNARARKVPILRFSTLACKIKEDKEAAKPYLHCPDCGAQYFTKNGTQAEHLLAMLNKPEPEAIKVPEMAPEKQEIEAPQIKTKYVLGVRVPA